MSESESVVPEPSSPDAAIASKWFEYRVEAFPHHTDYAGVVWHGSYVGWMEEARILALRSAGLGYDELVRLGFELPVVELNIRYHQFAHMGDAIAIKHRIAGFQGVRLPWEYEIVSPDSQRRHASARATLVLIDRPTGKIRRRWPPVLQEAIAKLLEK